MRNEWNCVAALGISVALALIGFAAHTAHGAKPESRPTTAVKTWSGTLRGGVVAIGGETTGWMLIGEGQTGGMDVDVSAVRAQAEKLDGKRVTLTGKLVEKQWVERGKQQLLVAEKIEPAPKDGK